MTTDTLRAAIEAALRRRDARGMAALLACDDADVDESIRATTAHTSDDALRALALACGLRDDGSDPAEEVERLRADNARLDNATRGALDDLAKVRAELGAARAVLRESEETARQASTRAEETVALLRTSIADLVPLRVAVREYLAARKAVTEVRYADESVAAHERVAAAFAMLGRLV